LVEQLTLNQRVVGSNPSASTITFNGLHGVLMLEPSENCWLASK
jgi:hypothetical protein